MALEETEYRPPYQRDYEPQGLSSMVWQTGYVSLELDVESKETHLIT